MKEKIKNTVNFSLFIRTATAVAVYLTAIIVIISFASLLLPGANNNNQCNSTSCQPGQVKGVFLAQAAGHGTGCGCYDKPICGNNILETNEECDGGLCCNANCRCDIGYAPMASTSCNHSCGDAVKSPEEQCDCGDDSIGHMHNFAHVNSFTCLLANLKISTGQTIPYHAIDTKYCTENCTVVSRFCGDGTPDPEEICEYTPSVQSAPCVDPNSYNGTKYCSSACDWGSCFPSESCGDGIINGQETCEKGITDTKARCLLLKTGGMKDFDGSDLDCDNLGNNVVTPDLIDRFYVGSCGNDCQLKCTPYFSNFGQGCYEGQTNPSVPSAGCQKGIFVCDAGSNSLTCVTDYFNPPQYDQCCLANSSGDYSYFSNSDNLSAMSILIMPTGATFRCDEECRKLSKVCVGVGLSNPQIDACIAIPHDDSVNCSLTQNREQEDCKKQYVYSHGGCFDLCTAGYTDPASPSYGSPTCDCPAKKYDLNTIPLPSGDSCSNHFFPVGHTACYCQ